MTVATLETVFDTFKAEGRLLTPIHSGPTRKPGRVGFRGELAIAFAEKLADEARPPKLALAQFMATAREGRATFEFLTGFLWDYADVAAVADVLAPYVDANGTHVLWCNNVDLLAQYRIEMAGVEWLVMPLDESTVYNETLDLLGLERSDLKKLDTGAKLDAMADAAAGFRPAFKTITYEEGLALAGPVKNPGEHRPV